MWGSHAFLVGSSETRVGGGGARSAFRVDQRDGIARPGSPQTHGGLTGATGLRPCDPSPQHGDDASQHRPSPPSEWPPPRPPEQSLLPGMDAEGSTESPGQVGLGRGAWCGSRGHGAGSPHGLHHVNS